MNEALKAHGALELFVSLATDRSMPDAKSLLGEGSREQQMQNFKSEDGGRSRLSRSNNAIP